MGRQIFAIKAEIARGNATAFEFRTQKTMYGGKSVKAGDRIFLFASENKGGVGLVARGEVTEAIPSPRIPNLERQTPRVSISVVSHSCAVRQLGRKELKPFSAWQDGRPETELNFKFYRQATDKLVGITDEAARFLDSFF